MFTHNINPVLLSIGSIEIRYYGLVYVLGFLLAFLFLELYRRKKLLKITQDQNYDLLVYLIAGTLIGARLFHIIFWNPAYFIINPVQIFMFWQGGLSFHGGLAGIVFAAYIFARKHKIDFWKITDILAIPALIALIAGRFANYANAEIFGLKTNVSWCVNFPDVEGCRHPYQFYSAIKRFFVLLVVVWISRLKNFGRIKSGFLFWTMTFLVCLGRFIIDFWRDDARFLGLAAGQYISIVFFVVSIFVLIKYYRKEFRKLF